MQIDKPFHRSQRGWIAIAEVLQRVRVEQPVQALTFALEQNGRGALRPLRLAHGDDRAVGVELAHRVLELVARKAHTGG